MKYYAIKFEELCVLSGVTNKKASYSNSISNVYSPSGKISYGGYGVIYIKCNNIGMLTELVTRKKFKIVSEFNSFESYFIDLDKSCKTEGQMFLKTGHVVDVKDFIKFFDTLKKYNLFETYVKCVTEIFGAIKENKVRVLSGFGKTEESTNPDDYTKGIEYDILKLKIGK